MNVELNVPEAVKAILVRAVTDLAAIISAATNAADPDCTLELRPSLGDDGAMAALAGITYALRSCSYASNDPEGYGGGVSSLMLGCEFLNSGGGLTDNLSPGEVDALDAMGVILGENPIAVQALIDAA